MTEGLPPEEELQAREERVRANAEASPASPEGPPRDYTEQRALLDASLANIPPAPEGPDGREPLTSIDDLAEHLGYGQIPLPDEASPERSDEVLREVEAALLSVRWPNGDRLDGVTKKTAAMMAAAVLPLLTAERERADHWERSASDWRKDCHTAWRERDEARERADRLARALAEAHGSLHEARLYINAEAPHDPTATEMLRVEQVAAAALSATEGDDRG